MSNQIEFDVQCYKTLYENLSQRMKYVESLMTMGGFLMMLGSMSPEVGSWRASYNPLEALEEATPSPDSNVSELTFET